MVGGSLVYFLAVVLVTGSTESCVLLKKERVISKLQAKGGIIDNVPGDALDDVLKNDALKGVLDGALKVVLADALMMLSMMFSTMPSMVLLMAFFSLVLTVYQTSLNLSLIHNVERPA